MESKKLSLGRAIRSHSGGEWFNAAKSILELAALVLIITLLNRSFISASNIKNLLDDIGPMLLMALGASPVILLGSTDLSIGAVASISSVAFCKLAPALGWWTYPVVVAIGGFSGFAIGFLNAKVRVPSFISSLAFMSIWSSLALVMTSGKGSLPLAKPVWYLIEAMRQKIFAWLPALVIPALLFLAIYLYMTRHTRLGKQIYAIGGNERAAYMAGIPVAGTKIAVFTLAGALYSLAGILYTAKLLSGSPDLGNDFTLLTIAAIALGGASLSGGKGSILGAVVGTCIAAVINNGMTMIGVGTWWQRVVFGLVILVAAYITSDKKLNHSIIVK